ncbi:YnjH family protein [Aeromonas hydrophila]|uniref:YnjH family protein n=1 Tax=Aeromonas hydrophila TaxID=644 RepID=UPI002B49DEAF|nr:YnjH family protein [Aeromonas hydrophila]
MYLGKRVGGWLLLALLGGATGTGVAAEPKRAEVGAELVLPLGSLPERVCWYQDQRYSLGARILQGDSWLECAPQNELESNGPLAWREPQRVSDAAGKATKSGTISVGQ